MCNNIILLHIICIVSIQEKQEIQPLKTAACHYFNW